MLLMALFDKVCSKDDLGFQGNFSRDFKGFKIIIIIIIIIWFKGFGVWCLFDGF